MENKQHDSLPEFDAKYIDQLFSANNPVKKKATPKAAAPEKPKPSAPKTPKKPMLTSSNAHFPIFRGQEMLSMTRKPSVLVQTAASLIIVAAEIR